MSISRYVIQMSLVRYVVKQLIREEFLKYVLSIKTFVKLFLEVLKLCNMALPCTKHVCQVPPEINELNNLILGTSIFAQYRRWFRSICMVSRRHPTTRTCFKSTASFNYERTRHATAYIYMVHPFSEFRIIWETSMIILNVLALLIIPFCVTFYWRNMDSKWIVIFSIFSIAFIIDVILMFFTGYYAYYTNNIILDPKIVVRKYCKGWFIVDLFTSLPIEYLALFDEPTFLMSQFSYLQVIKLIRIRTIVTHGRRLRGVYEMSFQTYKLLELVLIMILTLHWAACSEYYVPMMADIVKTSNEKLHPNWIHEFKIINETTYVKYTASLYRAVSTMTASLEYQALVTIEDIILELVLTILGRGAYMYLIAQLLQLFTSHGSDKNYLRSVPQLHEFMDHKQLSPHMQNRLIAYYKYCTQNNLDLERNIMGQLSSNLKEQLILERCKKYVKNVDIFECLPDSVVSQLTVCLRSEVCLKNDVIIKAGSVGDAMYFIASGRFAVSTSFGKDVGYLQDGVHFGELALVMDIEHSMVNVIAIEISQVYVLSRTDFQRIVGPQKDLMETLQRLALERIENTFVLDWLARSERNISDIFARRYEKERKNNKKNETRYPINF